MRILLIGGSGYVGTLVLPLLSRHHDVLVLDKRPPRVDGIAYQAGDITDPATLESAVRGVDALVHCAMGSHDWDTPAGAADTFDVNVKSVHLALLAAHTAGVPHAVHLSSLSVFAEHLSQAVDEQTTPDAIDPYGLSKRLGEEVCAAAVAQWGMSVTVLRLALPTPDALWPRWGLPSPPIRVRSRAGTPVDATAGTDVASAIHAALGYRQGFSVFTVAGDRTAGLWPTARARDVLGWQPTYPRD
jgi:nucleoside-diphosphate-sugar epimerase